jgi:hypothetical protein
MTQRLAIIGIISCAHMISKISVLNIKWKINKIMIIMFNCFKHQNENNIYTEMHDVPVVLVSSCSVGLATSHFSLIRQIIRFYFSFDKPRNVCMFYNNLYFIPRGRRGRDRMVVGFTTTCAISSNHHLSYEFESRSWRGVLDTTLWDTFFSFYWTFHS